MLLMSESGPRDLLSPSQLLQTFKVLSLPVVDEVRGVSISSIGSGPKSSPPSNRSQDGEYAGAISVNDILRGLHRSEFKESLTPSVESADLI